jgi:hypothetical protein
MNRDEAQGWLVEMLLEKVRSDPYPSATQLQIIEEALPRQMVPAYLEVLMDKVGDDNFPSIPMLRRISRVAGTLPRTEQQG